MKNNLKGLSDEELVVYVREKDKEAYEEVISRYQDKLLRYAEYLMGDSQAAADAVQEALIRAFVNLKGFDETRKFSSWIYRIVHNEVINLIKAEKNRKKIKLTDWLAEQLPSKANVEKSYEKQENKEIIKKCLSRLPVEYAAVLSLYYFEDKKYEEISEVLKIPLGTVGIRIKRGKEKLKQLCNNNGGL